MKTSLDSSDGARNAQSSYEPGSDEPTVAEEVRVFRVGICRWAAGYVARQDVMESGDASASLRNWSREYFGAMKDTSAVQGVQP
jgi:hypothetical protein